MYRRYLNSEITFGQLLELAIALGPAPETPGEIIGSDVWNWAAFEKMREPVNGKRGGLDRAETEKLVELAWYVEPDEVEPIREYDDKAILKMREPLVHGNCIYLDRFRLNKLLATI